MTPLHFLRGSRGPAMAPCSTQLGRSQRCDRAPLRYKVGLVLLLSASAAAALAALPMEATVTSLSFCLRFPRPQFAALQGRRHAVLRGPSSTVARASTADVSKGMRLPGSVGTMLQQAVQAVMAAFQDDIARQSVRLNLEVVCSPERLSDSGMPALLEDALPLARRFTERLSMPGGAAMKEVRISAIDQFGLNSGDLGTLLYRVTEDPSQDIAVVFLGSRNFAVEDSTRAFLAGMKNRLVVMLNSEDAASQFRIENQGKEFLLGGLSEITKLQEFCTTFKQETYYYRSKVINGYPTVVFRAYPQPWEVYIESIEGRSVCLKESKDKPDYIEIAAWSEEYDKANGISSIAKSEAFKGKI